MKKNKLFSALKTLNKKEFAGFGKFIQSPIFNESRILIKLYVFLQNHHPGYDSDELEKENIFKHLFPEEKYDDKKLRDKFTHMMQLLLNYFSFLQFEKDKFSYRKNLLLQLYERDLKLLFDKEIETAFKFTEDLKFKDDKYYLDMYSLEVIKRKFYEEKVSVNKRAVIYNKITSEIDYIVYFFIIVMLKEYSMMYNRERQVKFDHKFKFFEYIMNHLSNEKISYENIVIINMLYNFLSLYKNDADEKEVLKLKDLLVKNRSNLEDETFKTLFVELYNFCKRKEAHGHKKFGSLGFDLSKEMLVNDVFIQKDGYMTAHTYINLAANGLREGNPGWTEEFLNKYKNRVNIEQRENAYNYNFAVLYYMMGNNKNKKEKLASYNTALDYLSKVKGDDFYYMTRIKNHSLKIYYELNYFESALSLIDSYNHYLSRNKLIPDDLVNRYSNFIYFLRKLIYAGLEKDNIAAEVLKHELEKNNETEYKGWLLGKIDKLINSTG